MQFLESQPASYNDLIQENIAIQAKTQMYKDSFPFDYSVLKCLVKYLKYCKQSTGWCTVPPDPYLAASFHLVDFSAMCPSQRSLYQLPQLSDSPSPLTFSHWKTLKYAWKKLGMWVYFSNYKFHEISTQITHF